VTWLHANAPELRSLSDPVVIRSVLDALALKLDGTPAAATTVARKRAVLFNALELAVEQGKLDTNPMLRVRWRAPKPAAAIDPASVVNIEQARALLAAVAEVGPLVQPPPRPNPEGVRLPPPRVLRGGPLVAFFGCLYYAGMRPSEALALVEDDLQLPDVDDEWGLIRVSRNDPEVTTAWTDRGRREPRQLKHRAKGEVRVVPCSPELVILLRRHLREYGVDRHGRLFRGARGGTVKESVYTDLWQHARAHALTQAQAASSLAARPYDLRHSCVSTWLAAGVDPTLIAEWVGHSLAVLHRVYAHVLPGRDEIAKKRIGAMFIAAG
jgi:integrase